MCQHVLPCCWGASFFETLTWHWHPKTCFCRFGFAICRCVEVFHPEVVEKLVGQLGTMSPEANWLEGDLQRWDAWAESALESWGPQPSKPTRFKTHDLTALTRHTRDEEHIIYQTIYKTILVDFHHGDWTSRVTWYNFSIVSFSWKFVNNIWVVSPQIYTKCFGWFCSRDYIHPLFCWGPFWPFWQGLKSSENEQAPRPPCWRRKARHWFAYSHSCSR